MATVNTGLLCLHIKLSLYYIHSILRKEDLSLVIEDVPLDHLVLFLETNSGIHKYLKEKTSKKEVPVLWNEFLARFVICFANFKTFEIWNQVFLNIRVSLSIQKMPTLVHSLRKVSEKKVKE